MNIREQIAALRRRVRRDATSKLCRESADTMEKLLAVYEAVDRTDPGLCSDEINDAMDAVQTKP